VLVFKVRDGSNVEKAWVIVFHSAVVARTSRRAMSHPTLLSEGDAMNISGMVSDNVSEVLTKIIDFTISRHKVLTENLNNLHADSFVPMDLPVEEFAGLMECAIAEHKRSKRLLLCDTANVKFGLNGILNAEAVIDEPAQKLLDKDINEYFEHQLKKLSENALNQKVAAELLKQKQGTLSSLSNYEM
jgi:flagellar basal body rod protein FlgB